MKGSCRRLALILALVLIPSTATGQSQPTPQPAPVVQPPPATVGMPAQCKVPTEPLAEICGAAWKKSGLRKLAKNEQAFRLYQEKIKAGDQDAANAVLRQYVREPHYVCREFTEKAYKGKDFIQPLEYLRGSVDRQKDVIEGRWAGANRTADRLQIVLVVLGGVLTLVAAAVSAMTDETDPDLKRFLKIASIVLPVVVTVLTSISAYFDFRGIAAAEARASVGIGELQSEIDDAVLNGCVTVKGPNNTRTYQELGMAAVMDWQNRLSAILRLDSETYIKRHEAGAHAK